MWKVAGLFMASLSALTADDIVEAATIDGLSGVKMFRYITVPSIRPSLIVVLTTISITTLKVFDIVRTATGGQFETSVVANAMYDYSFRFGEDGKGFRYILDSLNPERVLNAAECVGIGRRCLERADPSEAAAHHVLAEDARDRDGEARRGGEERREGAGRRERGEQVAAEAADHPAGQLEHDRVIRLLQVKLKKRQEVVTNIGRSGGTLFSLSEACLYIQLVDLLDPEIPTLAGSEINAAKIRRAAGPLGRRGTRLGPRRNACRRAAGGQFRDAVHRRRSN